MAEFNTTGLEDVIEAFSRREQATVEAVPKMLKAGADADCWRCSGQSATGAGQKFWEVSSAPWPPL